MSRGKWIDELTSDMPLAEAALRVLTVRLEVVRDFLLKAVHEAAEDQEHVHQLRVGTRRAVAALDTFKECLPKRTFKKARKQLKKIRRAAGEARDWDVFLIGLTDKREKAPANHRPGLDLLFGVALAQRELAQTQFADLSFSTAGLKKSKIKNRKIANSSLGDLARPMLSDLLAELETRAGQDLDDYRNLHQVRIIGKRLRYAMEIFADCFAPPFREQMYPAVEEMQEILGNANDSHVASQRLAALRERLKKTWHKEWKHFRPGIEGLLRYHQRRLPQERQRFLTWWKRWQASGAEQTLAALIKTNPGETV